MAASAVNPARFRPAWYCLRSQPRHEHVAAAHLGQYEDFEVYLPRIRVPRMTRHRPGWRTEALFPNYLFARFDLGQAARRAQHTRGVTGIVHFGDHWPSIPEGLIAELRRCCATEPATTESQARPGPSAGGELTLHPGEPVVISGGLFHTCPAVVLRVMPAHARVAVLLDFLGAPSALELDAAAVLRPEHERRRVAGLNR